MTGVILDTSVWIVYFNASDRFYEPCQKLLDQRLIWTVDLIFGELVQGAKGKRDLEILDIYFQHVPKFSLPRRSIFTKHRLLNLGIGLIDSMIILACLKKGLQIWSRTKK